MGKNKEEGVVHGRGQKARMQRRQQRRHQAKTSGRQRCASACHMPQLVTLMGREGGKGYQESRKKRGRGEW